MFIMEVQQQQQQRSTRWDTEENKSFGSSEVVGQVVVYGLPLTASIAQLYLSCLMYIVSFAFFFGDS